MSKELLISLKILSWSKSLLRAILKSVSMSYQKERVNDKSSKRKLMSWKKIEMILSANWIK